MKARCVLASLINAFFSPPLQPGPVPQGTRGLGCLEAAYYSAKVGGGQRFPHIPGDYRGGRILSQLGK